MLLEQGSRLLFNISNHSTTFNICLLSILLISILNAQALSALKR